MDTRRWSVDKIVDNLQSYPQIIQASDQLIKNETVAFPTETVYGLGGNAQSDEAVSKIFAAKGRPADNPLIIHIAERSQLEAFVESVPEKAEKLISAFWPGPLTMIFNKKVGALSDLATAGLSTVAIRMPDHPVALALLKKTGLPIAAPSANSSGKPSPTTANHVWEDLHGRIAGIVDGGPTGVGVESTVIDCTEDIPTILRPGGITKEQLMEAIGEVRLDPALQDSEQAPKSPGMKYKHYAPDAPLYLVDGERAFMQKLVSEKRKEGLSVGVLTTEENKNYYDANVVITCGSRADLRTVASGLYDALRQLNHENVDIIYGEIFSTEGVGAAVMNRLIKAAGHRIITN
ncbi:L-threonylcarbamoyladenylate synthase [Cytobacillus horneckiae]|uniref:Threonylcarbamoyl-AMP synthase n=1 Tax=Cytobacillus horneckiae TaxID=549687 RepID=A0A2N0ZG05_9BACI|nr:L-threonylcarbamoyladenylate synthase [Cytobacillus horneckiae]MBN6885031.1 threonylcarbamoyl-AMP synthase [Cytobacillus horneckiae]MCM3179223.1 L-threonylcarbamoyladenylate synthase [Cytobacillus horneckiae]MEC1154445.1 L-threonylcarbamoyladenylate synthase [Cytobacillus horneckiae]MED2937780.1 L-threonylcarbamoyladenylate synthase [Cytobacillus horneckiae]PKG28427.1 threonylcarbamoyl-AMP synthase [Cytobacillus horneckiae]